MRADLARRAAGEAVGTAFLLAAVVGSGIMAEALANANGAVALLANSIATGGALYALILVFGPVSGAHFNPVVTLADAWQGRLGWSDVPVYLAAQVGGALAGVAAADVMFEKPAFFLSTHVRTGPAQLLGEVVATFGLMTVVRGAGRATAPAAVAAYITAAYWFTSSTSFANPAVTLARAFSDTFAGIRLDDVPAFVLAQLAGGAAAVSLFSWLAPRRET